jgi:hypothetical protein
MFSEHRFTPLLLALRFGSNAREAITLEMPVENCRVSPGWYFSYIRVSEPFPKVDDASWTSGDGGGFK